MIDRRWTWVANVLVCIVVLAACGNETSFLDDGPTAGCSPGVFRACYGTGQCAGRQVCVPAGTGWSSCDCGGGGNGGGSGGHGGGTVTCGSEVCNGLDDDCNGLVDDGIACPCDEVQWGGHSYYFCQSPRVQWEEARAACQAQGWRLLTIDDASEGDWASHEIDLRGGGGWWMGLNDLSAEGQWVWADGTPAQYTNWQPGEPSGGGAHCGHLGAFLPASTWNDSTCSDNLPYVCEVAPQGCVPVPPGVVSWWRMEGWPQDVVGFNDGECTSGVFLDPGLVGEAFGFDGENWCTMPTSGLPVGDAERTIEAWVRVNEVPSWVESFFIGYGAFGQDAATFHIGSVWPNAFFSQWDQSMSGGTLVVSRWHHVAATSLGGSVTLYVDGQAVSAGPQTLATPEGTTFQVGGLPETLGGERRLIGNVDEIAVYDRCLSAAEVRSIYEAGQWGKCP